MQNKVNPKLIGLLIKSVITIVIIVGLYVIFQKVPKEQQTNLVSQSQITDNSYTFNAPNYDNILESEELKVEIDTKTLSFRVNDKRNNFIWKSVLEEKDNDINDTWNMFFNSAITLEFFDETGNVRRVYSSRDGEITVENLTKKFLESTVNFKNIGATLDIVIELNNDKIDVRVKSIKEGNYKLLGMYIYPYLGASKGLTDGKFILADGVGALIDLSKKSTATAPLKMRIYGEDTGFKEVIPYSYFKNIKDSENYSLPLYGVLYKDNGLLAVIENGDVYSEINAYKSEIITPYNWIANRFILRELHKKLLNKEGQGIIIPQDRMNNVNPHIRYLFANNSNEFSLLQMFVDEKKKNIEIKEGHKPIMKFDFLMSEAKKTSFGYKLIEMTTQSQFETIKNDLSEYIKDAVYVLVGYSKGGYSINSPRHVPFEKSVIIDPKKLSDCYLYTDYINVSKESKYVKKTMIAQNKLEQFMEYSGRYLLTPKKVINIASSEKSDFSKYGIDKFALGSVGKLLYSTNEYERFENLELYKKIMEIFDRPLVYGSNWYVVENSSMISDIPTEYSGYEVEDEILPVIPFVLRQFRQIFSKPVNLASNYKLQILKCIEYGINPTFYLTYQSSKELIDTPSMDLITTKYADWKDKIIESYKLMESAYKIIGNANITFRKKLFDNVYLVAYSNGKKMIFNYSDNSVKYKNIEVPSLSYAEYLEVEDYENSSENSRGN
ncbi:hypothetical protein IM41_04875 [Fervidobacterium sp. SC_NGM5_G05]|nr:hypothetical protein IM41_04875 [Fervidobacterium sp. SC_NGM5_G05]